MKKILSYIIVAVMFVALTVTTGCRNKSKTNIVGTWKYVPYEKPGDETIYWTFAADNSLEFKVMTSRDTILRTYTYAVDKRNMTISDDGHKYSYVNGKFEPRGEFYIHHLGKDICKMEKTEHGDPVNDPATVAQNPYLMIELVKQ